MSVSALRPCGLIVILALTAACPSPNRNVDQSNTSGKEQEPALVADESTPNLGTYQCHWQKGDKGLDLPCEIGNEKGQPTLTLIVVDKTLQGVAAPTSFGFRFAGVLKDTASAKEQKVEADFFHQGEGAYAAVLTLADKSLVKLDLHR